MIRRSTAGFLAFVALAAVLAPRPALAGTIDPALAAELDALAPGGRATALVVLAHQADIAAIGAALSARGAGRAERHEVVVRALQEASLSQAALRAALERELRAGEIDGYTTYWIVNAVVVRGGAEAIRGLAGRDDVARASRNPIPRLIEPVGTQEPGAGPRGIGVTPGLKAVKADLVWRNLGITGSGRLVANIDTGVDGLHPALASRWRGNHGHPYQECWLDVLGEDTTYPEDSAQHGTHVMGTITGMGEATGDTIGVAWGAHWIACNAIGGGGGDFDSDILAAFQWMADPDGDPGTIDDVPDVVQNSWGINESFGYPDCFDGWWAVIDNCEAAGCVVTISAGNEGPDPMTLRSPADRATTPLNCFAVGAVDATNYGWPYPIADFSSRGPTGCPGNDTKPEVAAPGVDVYSSIPGGGYAQSGWSGTSMAGPHVAGVVALMREANPDLEVETIKQIILETSRDEGAAGDDNDYGWGFVDAFEAVSRAIMGTGVLEGHVVNATNGGTPVEGAAITLSGSAALFRTDAGGAYRGHALAGGYTATANHPSFAPQTFPVTITEGGVSVQDFSLVDVLGPSITDVSDPRTIPDEVGPYTLEATLADWSDLAGAAVRYRVNGGPWEEVPMQGVPGSNSGEVPGQIAGSAVDFYIEATDVGGNTGTFPADAPSSYRTFFVTEPALVDNAEADHGWSLGWLGDGATAGFWVREDPVGTLVGGRPAQPEDDHTTDPGRICFVTANGAPGGPATAADVDAGCTSLVSPVFDLSGAEEGFLYYWRWFGRFGLGDDRFTVEVSSNNGLSWTAIENLTENANAWTERFLALTSYVSLSGAMRLRFVACDFGLDSVVEGAVDDVSIEGLPALPSGLVEGSTVPQGPPTRAFPNPTRAATTIAFQLAAPAAASLEIFDAGGRRIRTLVDGAMTAGVHEVTWDGRDERGRASAPGVYFYRLRAGAGERSSRLTLLP